MVSNRPTMQELLESVREFLGEEIQPAVTDDSLQFKLRIASNVLAIVEREIAQTGQAEQERTESLRQLLDRTQGTGDDLNRELCERIQQGDYDEDARALLDHLELTTLNRLSIDNPGYSTYRQLVALRAARD
ncbi:MAG: DUF6285 domain-containing protein [Halioglobus sp.]